MLAWVVQRILGEAKAYEVERWLHGHQRAHEESVESIAEMDRRSLDLKSRFKGYVIDSLGRRRIRERELAELRRRTNGRAS